MAIASNSMLSIFVLAVLCGVLAASTATADTIYHDFYIQETNYTRLCYTKPILTVNGQFPGPTLYAHKGDTVIVNVYNRADYNITIHWHGVDQPRNPWSDGPEYITQCPIQPGANFTQRIELSEEEGTVWWHSHSDFDRATVYGAIVIHPKKGDTYPFPKPYKQIPILLGEWWIGNVSQILETALSTGGDIPPSNASTINGQPGDLLPCSKEGTFKIIVEYGKTYLLKIVNAHLTNELFFAVAGHKLTVVGTDGAYLKPVTVDYIMITPGQTFDVLMEANQPVFAGSCNTRYYMAAHPYTSIIGLAFDNTTTTATVEYNATAPRKYAHAPPELPHLTYVNDTDSATAFTAQLRSLADRDHPVHVPQTVDEHMLITVAVNQVLCPNGTCQGPNNNRLAASLNNASFQNPHIDILQAYYNSIHGVYTPDFPDFPPLFFNFTQDNLPNNLTITNKSTRVKVLEYNTTIEVVFQDTSLFGSQNHPMHLHGYSFYVVGRGFGNFNPATDPATYNLVDPPYENTVGVPTAGWTAIRFRASNPGVWFMHCHFDRHLAWGMDTVFIVKNGNTPKSQVMPPPSYMPPC